MKLTLAVGMLLVAPIAIAAALPRTSSVPVPLNSSSTQPFNIKLMADAAATASKPCNIACTSITNRFLSNFTLTIACDENPELPDRLRIINSFDHSMRTFYSMENLAFDEVYKADAPSWNLTWRGYATTLGQGDWEHPETAYSTDEVLEWWSKGVWGRNAVYSRCTEVKQTQGKQ